MSRRSPTERFSNRVAYYEQYRPGYPREILRFLEKAIGFSREWVVADIGSGTGLLTVLFARNGNPVFAVEPNKEMRLVAEARFREAQNVRNVDARAEHTSLAAESVDLVVAGQAFHWFDTQMAREEFRRVLRPPGWTALVYNSWHVPHSQVASEYARLVDQYGTDYKRVNRQNRMQEELLRFFGGREPQEQRFDNDQIYDFEALRGRALSSSYAPLPGHPSHEPFIAGLRELFDAHAEDGRLTFPYETTVQLGPLLLDSDSPAA